MPGMPNDPEGDAPPPPAGPGGSHKRRPRYRGTHPRRFEERYKERDPSTYPEMTAHILAQGRTPAGSHVPILVEEVLAVLVPAPGEVVADLTLGHGGHARALLARIGPTGRLLALDHDEPTLQATRARLEAEGLAARASFHAVHHAALADVLAKEGIEGCDVVLADLGLSSMQIDDPTRGFSFRHDGPLDMRMDRRRRRSASAWLASISEADLSAALKAHADEPDAARLACAIVQARAAAPLERTLQLTEIVLAVKGWTLPRWKAHVRVHPRETHPAARTFQALRILVNDEMAGLERLLRGLPWCLRPGGRAAILSFHSGEQLRVERAFRDGLDAGHYSSIADEALRATRSRRGAAPPGPEPSGMRVDPVPKSCLRRTARALALLVLLAGTLTAAEDFSATESAYRAYLARPSLFYRTRGRERLARTKDLRALPILAQDYAKAEDPGDIVRGLLVTLATRHLRGKDEPLPFLQAYEAWRSAHGTAADAWLWYRSLGVDLALGGDAALVAARTPARGPWLRAAALRAAADAKDARALALAIEALPPLGAKTPLAKKKPAPKKGVPLPNPAEEAVPAALLAEAAARVLLRVAEDRSVPEWRALGERVILLLDDPGLSPVTRGRIARSLARVFRTDDLGLASGPWLRELAAAVAGGREEGAQHGASNYFFGLEVVGEHIAFVIDCSDSMLAPLGTKPKKGADVTPGDGPARGPGDPAAGLPWERIHTRFDLAREMLKRSLSALRKDQSFAVVLFGSEAELLRDMKGMTPTTPAAVASALRALDDIQFDTAHTDPEHPYGSLKGKTNLHGGLRKAFRLRATDEASGSDYVDPVALEEGCDSVYLLSDGAPSWDDWAVVDTRDPDVQAGDPESRVKHENSPTLTHFGPFVNAYGNDFIVDDVLRLTLFRDAPVHCIAIGEADDNVMRRLANATGGRFERAAAGKPPAPAPK